MTKNTKLKVEELFKNASDRHEKLRENPVTGGKFVAGLDPLRPQKLIAQRALETEEWYEQQKPEDAPALPLTYVARERLKGAAPPLHYIVSLLARSLEVRNYRPEGHPSFEEYARGVMASKLTPAFIREDAELLRRYPPKPLIGLGGGLIWRGG